MLAAGNGLYVIDGRGRVITKVRKGDYVDVHCDGTICAAIEHVSYAVMDKIHIVSNVEPYVEQSQFKLFGNKAVSVHVTNDNVFVSNWDTDQVTSYSIRGQQLQIYRRCDDGNSALYWSRLCMSDDNGQCLVADAGHDRLQVLYSEIKKWRVVSGVKVRDPHDALITGNKLFVLTAGAPIYSIIMYKISDKC